MIFLLDNDGDLAAKLVGICDDVPTYELCDFMEVLQKISENPLHNLGKTRPLKVQYYLQVFTMKHFHKKKQFSFISLI